ncbi:MAG: 2-amino-4-hydroxy-6-hydroxymethyldihydropteridine diphosphokinase [Pseudomonadota bacterium]
MGSNLADPVQQVRRAREALAQLPDTRLHKCSHLYRTRPVGGVAQPDFINAVAGIVTGLSPEALFAALLEIEARAGRCRARETRWGPRTLDLDLLLFGDLALRSGDLEIPHPRLGERAFVLAPLAEVAGDWLLPTGQSVAAAWAQCPDRGAVERLADA